MLHLRVKNWDEYQHYSKRTPPWIKLHVKVLTDFQFVALAPASRCLLMLLWVLASENDGEIKASIDELRFRLTWPKLKEGDVQTLVNKGFLVDASGMLASASALEADATESVSVSASVSGSSKKKEGVGFVEFFAAYPKKRGKADAEKAWRQTADDRPPLAELLQSLEAHKRTPDWTKDGGQFIPYPATWLRGKRWEDAVAVERPPVSSAPRLTDAERRERQVAAARCYIEADESLPESERGKWLELASELPLAELGRRFEAEHGRPLL